MSGDTIALRACAKINWTLEVLGRRRDGYHELRTVLQTVALRDDVALTTGREAALDCSAPAGWDLGPASANLAVLAVEAYPVPARWRVRLRKRVPPAAGLGGGSSDAAAVLRGLDALAERPLGPSQLEALAATLGSDTPFFVRGGTQLAAGRGELLQRLPDAPPRWLVLVTPRLSVGKKTARLFGMLGAGHYADGAATNRLATVLADGGGVEPELLFNTFDHVADAAFPGLAAMRSVFVQECGHALLCGAGPALFALAESEAAATSAAARLRASRLPALAVRTASAAESTRTRRWPPRCDRP